MGKTRAIFLIFFLLSGINIVSFASDSSKPGIKQDFLIQQWTAKEGLPVNSVTSLAQTPDGFIWIATQEGLVRFDGFEFFTFSHNNTPAFLYDDVYSLLVCRDGSLLIGCHAGHLVLYKNRVFKLLTHPELYGGKNVTALIEDSANGYWTGTFGGGLGHFQSQEKFTFFRTSSGLAGNIIHSIVSDNKGGYWIGTEGGLSHFANGRFTNISVNQGLSENHIRCLFLDSRQALWIGTNNGGLNRYADGKITRIYQGNLKKNEGILSITADNSGGIWVGTKGSGLFRITDKKALQVSEEGGIESNSITCLFTDRDKNLWAGTSDAGISLLKHRLVDVYTNKSGLSDNVIMPVFKDHAGGIWIGTAKGGLNYYHHGRFEQFQQKLKLPSIPITTITEDHSGTLWIGTAGLGLYSRGNGTIRHFTKREGLGSDMISVAYVDHKGILWAGTSGGGVSWFENGRFNTISSHKGLSHDQINCLLQDKTGRMWVGTNGGGINRINHQRIQWITSESGLPDDEILSMYEDPEGIIWIGCGHQGLAVMRGDSVEVITSEDGLGDDKIFHIMGDHSGKLWMSGNNGIFQVSRSELLDLINGKNVKIRSIHYGLDEGMLSQECTEGVFPAGCTGNAGDLWFPTLNGLVRIESGRHLPDTTYHPVCLTRIFVNEKEINTDQPIELEPGMVNIEIQFTCPVYSSHQYLSYKYILEGFDMFWTEAGSRRSAFYTHLPPGNYEFKAVVFSPFTTQAQPTSLFKIKIRPYFYQTVWFFIFCILSGSLILWFIIRYQYRKIKERELKQLVEERTKELQEEIRQKERIQAALVEARDRAEQSDRMKSSLLSFLNQDFRTPVNSIMGFSEILMQEKPSQETGLSRYIHESGKRLLDTLDSAMLLAQVEPGTDPPSNLQDLILVIEAALHPLQPKQEILNNSHIPCPQAKPDKPIKDGPYTILLVEDNEINAALVKSYLGKDYFVDVAMDGETALIKVREKLYDAILMDINLGKGIDGLTATQKIRELPGYQNTPIIAVTGYTMAGMQERIIDGGCSYYLAKPFGKKLLIDLLITILPENKPKEGN